MVSGAFSGCRKQRILLCRGVFLGVFVVKMPYDIANYKGNIKFTIWVSGKKN